MTPDDLRLLQHDLAALDAEALTIDFYDRLFEVAPGVRPLFPDDLAEQRRKLGAELAVLVDLATSLAAGDHRRFVERAHRLGARHVRYGAAPAHYPVVGETLLDALATALPTWDDAHRDAWSRLHAVVAETMLEGARLAGA